MQSSWHGTRGLAFPFNGLKMKWEKLLKQGSVTLSSWFLGSWTLSQPQTDILALLTFILFTCLQSQSFSRVDVVKSRQTRFDKFSILIATFTFCWITCTPGLQVSYWSQMFVRAVHVNHLSVFSSMFVWYCQTGGHAVTLREHLASSTFNYSYSCYCFCHPDLSRLL